MRSGCNAGIESVDSTCTGKMLERITIEQGRLGGKACVRGLRISVAQVLALLASGLTHEDFQADYPDLEKDDITACLLYASRVLANEL